MEIENILAKNITAAGEKAAYDAACKRLLANKVILAWIMKSCLEEYKEFSINDIAEKYRSCIQEENLVGQVPEQKENYDLLTVVMICLGRAGHHNYTGILKLLDVLLSSEKKAEEKKKILMGDFDIAMTKKWKARCFLCVT